MLAAITVTSLGDDIAEDGYKTLREAIIEAENTPVEDTIDFSTIPANNFNNLSLDGGTILLQLGELDITEAVTIDATMLPNGITIDANDADGFKNGNGRSLKV